jgi:hypothetical protein
MNKMSSDIGNLTSMFQTLMTSQTSQNTTAHLPSQPEVNPKQCGAISSSNAVTTRSGKTTVDRANTQPVYVTPPRKT